MKVINTSGNTIYADDIDMYFPYANGKTETLDPDLLKKSRCVRGFILNRMLEVVEYDENERIENSLMYILAKGSKHTKEPEPEIEEYSAEELVSPSGPIEVKIHGIFLDAGGYAKVNRNVALKLHEAGLKIKIDPKRSQNQLNEEELKPILRLQNTTISRNHILIDSVIPSFAELSSGKYKVLYTTIESYTIPKQFMDSCQMYDEIWLTSVWSASILREQIDKPIYSVITGVDHEHYCEEGPKFDLKPNVKDFVFVSVFGWNYRKGYDVLLKAYFDEFSSDDNVTLLLVSRYQSGLSRHHRNKIRDDIEEIMKEFPNKNLPHVARYSKVTPEKDMPKLYRACHCFILSTRGEGGNLCAPEAAMCGLPVIMTNCSGQQGYLRSDNSYMIEIDHLEEIRPGQMCLHYWDGQKFPSLKSDKVHSDVKLAMRSVVNNYAEAKSRNKRMQELIMKDFTWNNTANQAIARLEDIHKKIKGR